MYAQDERSLLRSGCSGRVICRRDSMSSLRICSVFCPCDTRTRGPRRRRRMLRLGLVGCLASRGMWRGCEGSWRLRDIRSIQCSATRSYQTSVVLLRQMPPRFPRITQPASRFALAVHRVVKLLRGALLVAGLRTPCDTASEKRHERPTRRGPAFKRTAVLFDHLLLLRELRLHQTPSAHGLRAQHSQGRFVPL